MKKVFYKNWLAKHFLPFAHTITLGPFVLSKCEVLPQRTINHECVHSRQWIELTVSSGTVMWLLMLMFNLSAWWLLLSVFVFYIWYLVEFIVRFIILRSRREAYRTVSFEQEAREAEGDSNYLENSHYFAWTEYFKIHKC